MTGHGTFASGIARVVELLLGMPENFQVVDFDTEKGVQIFADRLKRAYEMFQNLNGVIFLCDIEGGTPYNQSIILLEGKENCRILTGVNLNMALTAAANDGNIDDVAQQVIEAGRDGIKSFSCVTTEDYGLVNDLDCIEL